PDAIVQQVQKDVAAVMANPKVREAMETRGFIPVGSTPAQFSDTIKKEAVQWQKVIKAGNIKPE
ncbi:MAG: tripartite tricarboxylate transporter substrate binding protein, partial [Rhizobiales bacterium]|nr:tripartite tricarboxylate transporter substrate binding protein [Hyphomicrobiales bacterium]